MGKIFLVRHGETYWNLEKRLQGRKNSKLTTTGKDQAWGIARYLRDCEVDLIYTSTLGRCLQVARIVAKSLQRPVIKSEDLIEMSFGRLEGNLESKVAFELGQYLKNKANYRFPDGENYDMVYKRVRGTLEDIVTKSHELNILIVGHQAVNRVILGFLLALPKETFVDIDHPHHHIYEVTGKKRLFCHDTINKKRKELKIK